MRAFNTGDGTFYYIDGVENIMDDYQGQWVDATESHLVDMVCDGDETGPRDFNGDLYEGYFINSKD